MVRRRRTGAEPAAETRKTRRDSAAVAFRVTLVALAALVPLGFAATQKVAVVDRGQLLSWIELEVESLEFWDRFTVYRTPETSIGFDEVNGLLLATLSGMAFLVTVVLDRMPGSAPPRVRWFFLIAWLGAAYLAVDELFGLHETIGINLPWLRELPAVDHPDDVLLAAYGLVAGVVLVALRDVAFPSRRIAAWFAASFATYASSIVMDLLKFEREDVFELLASALLLVAFAQLATEWLIRRVPIGGAGAVEVSPPSMSSVGAR
jgi:hypothetical protein